MAEPLRPSIRISGGNPAGFPDYRPLNPWGRAMPKSKKKPKPDFYQVVVETSSRDGTKHMLPVSPRASREFCMPLCSAIETEIAAGRERTWKNPCIVKVL